MDNKDTSYIDRPYEQKRKTLRKYYTVNPIAFELCNMVKYKVLLKIDDNKFINSKEFIDTLLVDGYIMYEKVYDDDNLVSVNRVDPLSFTMGMEDGKVIWHQNKGKDNYRVLIEDNVLYVMSPISDFFTSFVEMIFLKVVNKDSKYTIKYCVDELVECYKKNISKL